MHLDQDPGQVLMQLRVMEGQEGYDCGVRGRKSVLSALLSSRSETHQTQAPSDQTSNCE